ncbi:Thiamine biosynthesis lipoprotein ApbE precursor [Microbulbifer aggregans]|uniref:FAD:protein FMN transferase n=1 Tax=Microbulbifer aggregans TaxID=1769779 RepID=A0A1C9W9H0_9GAMM|nr:FAD:protein FMN transferase [Microbulbifer aggregans]AOS97811.1 Thiamine biosynthesis lipoprotein ApbE precursor [Microbulbifer aggregans]
MGTRYHITVVNPPAAIDRAELLAAVDEELEAVNREMSTYIPDSELMRFNRGPVGEAVPVSRHLAEVVELSLDISQRSKGAFDITVGPLVNLWGFGPRPEPEATPSDTEIAALLETVGSDALRLERNPDRLTRKRPVELDLSAIAKGHGVDRVARLLEQRGIDNYLVEIGGELRTLGMNPKGAKWRIGIEKPVATGNVVQVPVEISGFAMATSGDYRNYYERDGVRYAHSIDPRDGRPLQHRLASVTVIADSCAEADGLATALNVMGAEAGLQLAEREGLAVYMLVKSDEGFEPIASTAFQPFLERSAK